MSKYDFDFGAGGPYLAALELLDGTDLDGRAVLDVGCGSAALAEPLRLRGAEYIGIDVDPETVEKLTALGFTAHVVDVTAPDVADRLTEVVGVRDLAAVLCLDVLEHTPEPGAVLDAIAAATAGGPAVELVVSIPNIAHVDIARRLLAGRWDMTETGLLDRTHLRFFTERSLTEAMAESGWFETARADVRLDRSDQFLAGHPLFEPGTVLGRFLGLVRDGADDTATVNQFVRRYHRGGRRRVASSASDAPFLSVVVRTLGTRQDTLVDTLCCLAAQTDLDFEVVLVLHGSGRQADVEELVATFEGNLAQRVRLVTCDGGGRGRPSNAGLRAAAGRYVAFLDDDDLVTADWVANFHDGARAQSGQVIRCWAAEQGRRRGAPGELAAHTATGALAPVYAAEFDLIRHLRQNETPFHCFAFPRALLDLGFSFDENLTVCEDWQFLVRAASWCGVHDTERMTCVYNKWAADASAHAVSAEEWGVMRSFVHVALDERPLLLPPGSVRALDAAAARSEEDQRELERLRQRIAALETELEEHKRVSLNAHQAIDELKQSTSWRVSSPIRAIGTAHRSWRDRRRD